MHDDLTSKAYCSPCAWKYGSLSMIGWDGCAASLLRGQYVWECGGGRRSRRWSSSDVRFGEAAEALFFAVAESVDMILGAQINRANRTGMTL